MFLGVERGLIFEKNIIETGKTDVAVQYFLNEFFWKSIIYQIYKYSLFLHMWVRFDIKFFPQIVFICVDICIINTEGIIANKKYW